MHVGIPLPWSRHPTRADTPLPELTPPGADTPLGADTPQEPTLPGADICLPGADTPPPRADTPHGIRHPPGAGSSIWVMSGRYASYWNAFLFRVVSLLKIPKDTDFGSILNLNVVLDGSKNQKSQKSLPWLHHARFRLASKPKHH